MSNTRMSTARMLTARMSNVIKAPECQAPECCMSQMLNDGMPTFTMSNPLNAERPKCQT
jgi:hypothetical protein